MDKHENNSRLKIAKRRAAAGAIFYWWAIGSLVAFPERAIAEECRISGRHLNQSQILELIDKLSMTKKDVYETSAIFRGRLLQVLTKFGLSPGMEITLEFEYPAWPENAYNADKETLEVTPYPGNRTAIQVGQDYLSDFEGITLKKSYTELGRFIGQNGFGATVPVSSTYLTEYSAVWPQRTVDFPILAKKEVRISPSLAKNFRKGLKTELKGRLMAPFFVSEQNAIAPTMQIPVAGTVHTKALTIQPECLVIVDATKKPIAEWQVISSVAAMDQFKEELNRRTGSSD